MVSNDRDYLILYLLHELNIKVNILMATTQDALVAIAAQSTVEDSTVELLNQIVQQLKDAQASNDPAALDAVVAGIQANTKKLSDAVANIPAK